MPPLIALKDIGLTFGGTPLLTGAGLAVHAGDRICLVGRNGSGKSTLLKIAAGLADTDSGERFAQPGCRIAYLPQEPDLSAFETTLAYVEDGFEPGADAYRARLILEALGLSGHEATGRLSGGEARRAALARTLAPEPDVLLLDEPTNHLDLPAIEWLEAELKGARAALVVISHDRRFLEALSRTTVWLDRGETRVLDAGFARFEAWRDEVLAREDEDRHKLDRKIHREEQWMHGGVTARRKRNVRRVADLQTLRETRRSLRKTTGNVTLEASDAQGSGKLVVEALEISKAYDPARVLVDGFSTRIARGDRVGLVGANGAGKTTLLKMLIGELAPDTGTIRLGSNIERVWIDQARATLTPGLTVTDALTGGRGDWVEVNGQKRHVATYLKEFLFLPEQARSPVAALSGGERARLILAKALATPSNLMVLDEPTNDLDLETLDLLQELIADYSGTVLLVSHDRDFLDRTVTSVIAADGEGRWLDYAGGYSDMIAQRRGARLAERRAADTASAKSPRQQAAASVSAVGGARKRKLSFKEKHALETLPSRIEALAAEAQAHRTALADGKLYARDPDRFTSVSARLADAEAKLKAAENQWLELELLREAIEG